MIRVAETAPSYSRRKRDGIHGCTDSELSHTEIMFGPLPFSQFSENDVRETVIRPLLGRLGYSPDMVTTQLPLRYRWLFLGHKKGASKDRPLRGEADYIMDVDRRLRWVVEAKKPGEITEDDREQAFSYAMHPEVRAVVFSIISGDRFEFYSTFHHPECGPFLAFTYDQLQDNLQTLANSVSPDALRRNFPDFVLDTGRPLAPGLRSFAKVERGSLTYTEAPDFVPGLVGTIVHITEGSVVRVSGGGIVALVKPSFHHRNFTAFSDAIGATVTEVVTSDEVLSLDPLRPTIFSHQREIVVKEGTEVPDLLVSGRTTPALVSVSADAAVVIAGYMCENKFIGKLVACSRVPEANIAFRICANIELILR